MKNKPVKISIILLIILGFAGYYFFPRKTYTAEHFNIITIMSNIDKDNDGIDDYTDIMHGAREDAKNRPKYKSAYYAGGYPPDDEGVCTDTIWRAFKNAGYLLKDLVDADIKSDPDAYPCLDKVSDPNIDFRRVCNLYIYFERNETKLSLDPYKIEDWQPGDIVVFGPKYHHIGIISDKRNSKGIPYVIHNSGQLKREEDVLIKLYKSKGITGHYRIGG